MFWYLATPYTKYPKGFVEAHREACRQASLFVKAKIPVFCPIAHTHSVAKYGGIDTFDLDVWLPFDRVFMETACGIIVCKMSSWEISLGVRHEIDYFTSVGKPVIYMEPNMIPEGL